MSERNWDRELGRADLNIAATAKEAELKAGQSPIGIEIQRLASVIEEIELHFDRLTVRCDTVMQPHDIPTAQPEIAEVRDSGGSKLAKTLFEFNAALERHVAAIRRLETKIEL